MAKTKMIVKIIDGMDDVKAYLKEISTAMKAFKEVDAEAAEVILDK
jgi:hypothetical protein